MIDDDSQDLEIPAGASPADFGVLQRVIEALAPLTMEARIRIWRSAAAFLQIDQGRQVSSGQDLTHPPAHSANTRPPFSGDTSMSPKEFLLEKQPRTDVERIACLAYYLTHYRGTPHFKTADLSLLNTEAAQPRFANTAYSANNAVKQRYLVPSTKGQRQLSAAGERFVRALPDRDAARAALESMFRKPRTRRPKPSSPPSES